MSGEHAPDFALTVYGGAFDPPHPGHESAIHRALFYTERITSVPSHRHVFGKRMDDFGLCCRWLARLAQRIDPRRVCYEPIGTGLMLDCPAVYSIGLLEALVARSGLTSTRITLLIGADNETGLLRFEHTVGLCQRFGRLMAEERLPLHGSMIRQYLHEGLAIPEAWCLPGVKDELYCYGGGHQAV